MQNTSKLVIVGFAALALVTSTCWAVRGNGVRGIDPNNFPNVNPNVNINNNNINVDRNFNSNSYPYGSYPAGSYPAGGYPAGAYPGGSYPYNSNIDITVDRSNINNFNGPGDRNSN